MKRLAQFRYSDDPVETEDLDRIYELTYKHQMLTQEQNIGYYGAPQPLSDKAYLELAKVNSSLHYLLDKVYDKLIDTYDQWIEDHTPDERYLEEMAWDSFTNWAYSMNYEEVINYFGEEAVLKVMKEYITRHDLIEDPHYRNRYESLREKIEESVYPEWEEIEVDEEEKIEPDEDDVLEWRRKYLESLEMQSRVEYQKQFPFGPLYKTLDMLDIDAFEEVFEDHEADIIEILLAEADQDALIEPLLEEEKERYYEDTAYGGVVEMRADLDKEIWDATSFRDKVRLFQIALTTLHNNDLMAQYVLADPSAVNILDKLSEGEEVPEWNTEISSWLGYPVGSRLAPEKDVMREPLWPVYGRLLRVIAALLRAEVTARSMI
jgi:hypothetical protein